MYDDVQTRADERSRQVVGAAIEAHRHLGPGLLESAYESCLCRELALQKVPFECQAPLPIEYKGRLVDCAYRLDLLVDDCLIVELKSVDKVLPIHVAQVLTYLRLSKKRLGLLINFNVRCLKDGLKRLVQD